MKSHNDRSVPDELEFLKQLAFYLDYRNEDYDRGEIYNDVCERIKEIEVKRK